MKMMKDAFYFLFVLYVEAWRGHLWCIELQIAKSPHMRCRHSFCKTVGKCCGRLERNEMLNPMHGLKPLCRLTDEMKIKTFCIPATWQYARHQIYAQCMCVPACVLCIACLTCNLIYYMMSCNLIYFYSAAIYYCVLKMLMLVAEISELINRDALISMIRWYR